MKNRFSHFFLRINYLTNLVLKADGGDLSGVQAPRIFIRENIFFEDSLGKEVN